MTPFLKAGEWDVRPAPLAEAQALVREFHYARGGSLTAVYVHGLYSRAMDELCGDFLCGVAWWLPPTRVAAESVNKHDWRKVLSLTRMVMRPEVPKNACSFLLARSVKAIKRDGRFVSLVTYADEGEGHPGWAYRASNWTYVGAGAPTERWVDPATGRHVSKKSAAKTRTDAEMAALGYVKTGKTKKHKYVLHLRRPVKPIEHNAEIAYRPAVPNLTRLLLATTAQPQQPDA